MSTSGGVRRSTKSASIASTEDRIARLSHEETYVFKNGELIARNTGSADGVQFSDAEISRMGGAILTHNHPQVRSFSNADVEMAYAARLGELRAVDAQYAYSMKPPTGQTWSRDLWNHGDSRARVPRYPEAPRLDRARGHADVFSRIHNRVRSQFALRVQRGELTQAQADVQVPHEVWQRFALATGVRYTRVPR